MQDLEFCVAPNSPHSGLTGAGRQIYLLPVIQQGEADTWLITPVTLCSQADGGNLLCVVDDVEHNISVWDWARGEKGQKVT